MNSYKVIADKAELEKFIAWLPDLEVGEGYYGVLLARGKYVRGEGVSIGTFNSDRHQCARFMTSKERLAGKIWQTEAPVGSYFIKDQIVPQEALAFYMNPNPRSHVRAQAELIKQLVDNMAKGQKDVHIADAALTTVHKSVSRKIFADFDVDGNFVVESIAPLIAEAVNPSAVSIVTTRGGFHILVKLSEIEEQYKKTWWVKMANLPGVDRTGDTLLPVPGTYQGGFVPRLYPLSEFLREKVVTHTRDLSALKASVELTDSVIDEVIAYMGLKLIWADVDSVVLKHRNGAVVSAKTHRIFTEIVTLRINTRLESIRKQTVDFDQSYLFPK